MLCEYTTDIDSILTRNQHGGGLVKEEAGVPQGPRA